MTGLQLGLIFKSPLIIFDVSKLISLMILITHFSKKKTLFSAYDEFMLITQN
jgi:hypothetical protein